MVSDDFDVSASFQLSSAQGIQTNLELISGFDITNLPENGEVSFFIVVGVDKSQI